MPYSPKYEQISPETYNKKFTSENNERLRVRTIFANIRLFIFTVAIPSYIGIMAFLNSNEFYVMPKWLYMTNQAFIAIYYIILSILSWIGIVHNGDSGETLDNPDLIHYVINHNNRHHQDTVEFQNMDDKMIDEYSYLKDIILPKDGTIKSINPYRRPHESKKNHAKCKYRRLAEIIKQIIGYHV